MVSMLSWQNCAVSAWLYGATRKEYKGPPSWGRYRLKFILVVVRGDRPLWHQGAELSEEPLPCTYLIKGRIYLCLQTRFKKRKENMPASTY